MWQARPVSSVSSVSAAASKAAAAQQESLASIGKELNRGWSIVDLRVAR
jgi:hypothetical protein